MSFINQLPFPLHLLSSLCLASNKKQRRLFTHSGVVYTQKTQLEQTFDDGNVLREFLLQPRRPQKRTHQTEAAACHFEGEKFAYENFVLKRKNCAIEKQLAQNAPS
jgi:hypothetical protein